MSTVISLRDVGKRYTKYEDAPALVNVTRRLVTRTRRSQLWAVRGVDLEVQQGECLGVIGRNGSGKSTLLQMLCGVTAPTEGTVRVQGRIAPLISVGVGFHPELTGRENVYINATILGLSRREIDKRLDAIIDFSGIEAFIDTPVKFYSSGMFVRLGFSVAVQVDPDVLLVDEVLAVGDLSFQMKCFDRMRAIRESGATVIFVTHNLTIVRNLCDRAILMDAGGVVIDGRPAEAIDRFHEVLNESREPEGSDIGWMRHVSGVATLRVLGFYDADGQQTRTVTSGREVMLRMQITAEQDLEESYAGLALHGPDGSLVYSDSNHDNRFGRIAAGEVREVAVSFRPEVPTGSYNLHAALYRTLPGQPQQQLAVTPSVSFHVAGRPLVGGVADLHASFTVASPQER